MDMIDRYLNAVAAQLPADERADIIAELRDLILSRFEAREEELGRPLTGDEQEDILHEIGHPLVVAARYRKGPDALVGPELFPYWLFGVKAGLLILLAVQALGLLVRVLTGPEDIAQAISQAINGLIGSGLTLIGVATVAAAVVEHYGLRPKWLTQWRVKDLSAFGLSDPAIWSAAMSGGLGQDGGHDGSKGGGKSAWTGSGLNWSGRGWSRRGGRAWPGSEHLLSLVANGLFAAWWTGLIYAPGLMQIRVDGAESVVSGGPIWAALHTTILVYVLARMASDLFGLLRPQAVRLLAVAQIAVAAGGLWLAHLIFEARHWFTLTLDGESTRIEGYVPIVWDHDGLAWLGLHGRTLTDMSQDLAMVLSWGLALIALGLIWEMLTATWRLVRG
ncbi:hypothetical protein [uncultured Brevundimonas sp.]|uniref:HAAS signaling domain-containing protein n=1 Tax=uncultured Brevundimonas sp. TaxID=213418 RepID=UPI0030ED96CB|tara:strand:- start:17439 stop:18608 length:1170 start_codon:yes stop_codon:yes gene_type:complete